MSVSAEVSDAIDTDRRRRLLAVASAWSANDDDDFGLSAEESEVSRRRENGELGSSLFEKARSPGANMFSSLRKDRYTPAAEEN